MAGCVCIDRVPTFNYQIKTFFSQLMQIWHLFTILKSPFALSLVSAYSFGIPSQRLLRARTENQLSISIIFALLFTIRTGLVPKPWPANLWELKLPKELLLVQRMLNCQRRKEVQRLINAVATNDTGHVLMICGKTINELATELNIELLLKKSFVWSGFIQTNIVIFFVVECNKFYCLLQNCQHQGFYIFPLLKNLNIKTSSK